MIEPFVAFFDVETQARIDDMPGNRRDDKIKRLPISCASVLTTPLRWCLDPVHRERAMEESRMRTFWVDGQGGTSLDAMCSLLGSSSMIVGYNVFGFDWPVTRKYFNQQTEFERCREVTHDVFSRVRDVSGVWFKLDALLKANNLDTKSADGLQAIEWWDQGNRADLQQYCELDVTQLAKLSLLPTMLLPGGRSLNNHVHGVQSALASLRAALNFEQVA